MSKKFPLQPLLDLANTKMDEATRRLGELITSERSCQQKLEMLKDYRTEYQARFTEAVRNGIGPEMWRNFTAFLTRIDEAIQAQSRIVEKAQYQTVQGQQVWIKQRNRVKAFDTLALRHQTQILLKENRQEQKMTDEYSSKNYRFKENQ